jgi:NAD(P)-dependent dehydrogenase (short-subunit alcohol dehydrogenase family)
VAAVDDRHSTLERMRLDERVALVTGAHEVGLAVAAGLANAGAEVAVSAPTADELRHVVQSFSMQGVRVHPIAWGGVEKADPLVGLSTAIDALGQIDILVHVADGCPFNNPYVGIRHDGLGEAAEECLRSVARVCEQIGRYMAQRKTGSVIIIDDPETLRPWPELTAGAMKSARLELIKLVARKWASDGVRINTISPKRIGAALYSPVAEERSDAGLANVAMTRGNYLDSVTDAAIWLASDAARFVTGTHIPLDGGVSISVAKEWLHLFEDLLVEDGNTSSARRKPRLASISSLRIVDGEVDRAG